MGKERKGINLFLSLAMVGLAIFNLVRSFQGLKISIISDLQAREIAMFLGGLSLTIVGAMQIFKEEAEKKITGFLLLVIVMLMCSSGAL